MARAAIPVTKTATDNRGQHGVHDRRCDRGSALGCLGSRRLGAWPRGQARLRPPGEGEGAPLGSDDEEHHFREGDDGPGEGMSGDTHEAPRARRASAERALGNPPPALA